MTPCSSISRSVTNGGYLTVQIDWSAIVGICTLLAVIGGAISWFTHNALDSIKDNIEALRRLHVDDLTSMRAATKLLFEKYDLLNSDMQHYKLHVAETYVNQAALEKILLPIERRLDSIENELRARSK